jgi:hypothetical protein
VVNSEALVLGLGRQQAERGCALSRLFHQLFVFIKRAGITDFATVDDKAEYSGLSH